jgi:hypothetical protein
MAEAKIRKNTFFAWLSIKQMNELANQTPEVTPSPARVSALTLGPIPSA